MQQQVNFVHLGEFIGNSETDSTCFVLANSWILDTEANNHQCCDKSLFDSLVSLESPISLFLPDDSSKLVYLTKNIVISPHLTLSHVLYCPYFKHNLISIDKLATQNNAKVIFFGDGCWLQDQLNDNLIGRGKVYGDLYFLEEKAKKVVDRTKIVNAIVVNAVVRCNKTISL